MNRATTLSTDGDGLRINSIIISPAAQKVASTEDVYFGLRCHRDLDSLPFGFVGRRGKKFMAVTTADLSKTMLVLATELDEFTKNLVLRELNERTALKPLASNERITSGSRKPPNLDLPA